MNLNNHAIFILMAVIIVITVVMLLFLVIAIIRNPWVFRRKNE